MTVGRVNINAAFDSTNTIGRMIDAQTELLSSYMRLIDSFEGNWSGQGYIEFKKTLSALSPKAREHFNNLRDYNNQIINLLERFKQADDDSKRQFDNV
jgi:uncharacterized protein YukE